MASSTVHVIDDDEAMRDSLAFLLASSGFNVSVHDSAQTFLDKVDDLTEGCVVTDVLMPGITGIDLLKALQQKRPEMSVVVMTGHGDIAMAVEAMKAGAVDFIEKPFDDEAMQVAVERACQKREQHLREEAEKADLTARIEQLSPRERDVLAGIVAGKQNKVIAYDLSISPRTVEVYRANLMMKMQASGLSQLVRMALRAGFPEETSGSI